MQTEDDNDNAARDAGQTARCEDGGMTIQNADKPEPDDLSWFDEYIERPDFFPADGDSHYWDERRMHVRDLIAKAGKMERALKKIARSLIEVAPLLEDHNVIQKADDNYDNGPLLANRAKGRLDQLTEACRIAFDYVDKMPATPKNREAYIALHAAIG